jgi:hypothetical protein
MANGLRTTGSLIEDIQPLPIEATPTIIAPMLTGTATPGAKYEISSIEGEASALFGAGSTMQLLIDTFRDVTKEIPLYVAGVSDDPSGIKASSIGGFAGTPTEAGKLTVSFGIRKLAYEIPIAITDTPTTLAGKFISAIANIPESIVTATNTLGAVTVTAKNAGTHYNKMPIFIEGGAPGVTFTLSDFTGGSGDPSLTGVLSQFDNLKVDILCPFGNFKAVQTYLKDKFNTDSQLLSGVAFTGHTDTFNNILALTSTDILQDIECPSVPIMFKYQSSALEKTSNISFDLDLVLVTTFFAQRAVKLASIGASTSEFYSITSGLYPVNGGYSLYRRPYTDMVILNANPQKREYDFTPAEQRSLEAKGFGYFKISDNGLRVLASNFYLASHLVDYDVLDAIRNITTNEFRIISADYFLSDDEDTRQGAFNADIAKGIFLGIYDNILIAQYSLVSTSNAIRELVANSFRFEASIDGRVSISFKVKIAQQIKEISINFLVSKFNV